MTNQKQPEINIVHASMNDVAQLVQLAQILGYETDEISLTQRMKKISTRDDNCLLVAREGEDVIGFCHGYIRTLVEVRESVEIGGLVVTEAWQGKGIAKALVGGIENWTKEKGLDLIVLSSNISRIQAHGFYEHLGYKKIKQQFALEKKLK